MTYQDFVLSALLKDLSMSFVFLIPIPLIYFGAQLHKEPARGFTLTVLTLFWGGWALFGLFVNRYFLRDYIAYLQYGDSYLKEKICVVDSVSGGTVVSIVSATQVLYCADGSELIIRHRRDYQRIFPKEGRTFWVRYLPKSGLIVDLRPLDSETQAKPEDAQRNYNISV